MDLQLGSTTALIDECRRQGLLRNQCAYVLATAWHETAHTMKPIYERGSKAYFNKYDAGTKIGKNLGNTNKGDGYLYRGRGFVQLTGRANYAKYGLSSNPDEALHPKVAAEIAVMGMKAGAFTGKKLSTYLTEDKSDYFNARAIINGDKNVKVKGNKATNGQMIASYAREYDMDLEVLGYAQKKPASTKPAPVATIVPIGPKPVPAPTPATDREQIKRVQESLTKLGYNPGGADGLMGPLTKGSILSFRNDNGLPAGDGIDEELITKLQTAQPRKMVPERANADSVKIATVVPEVNKHWWNKYLAIGGGATTAIGGAVEQLAPATGYLQPVKDFLGDIPTTVWIVAIVLVAGVVWWNSRQGQIAGDDAYRAGDRR